MNPNHKEWLERIGFLIASGLIILFFYTITTGQIKATDEKVRVCAEAHGTIEHVSCGYACGYEACVIEEDGKFYRKEIQLINGKYVLLEGGRNK